MYFVMIGVILILSMAFIASVVLGNIFLQQKAKHLNELKIEDKVLDEQQGALLQANKDLAKNAELEKIAKSVVPQDKDQAKAVLEIIEIAKQSNIKIKSITFPSSNLGVKNSSGSSTPSSGDSSSKAPAPPPISQAKPVQGIDGVYSLEMNIIPDDQVPVNYYQFLDFLSRLENNRRTAQVSQIKITPQTPGQSSPITFTLTINIFIKPWMPLKLNILSKELLIWKLFMIFYSQ